MIAVSTSSGTGQYVASEWHIGCYSRRVKSAARRGVLIHGGRTQTALSNMPPDSITAQLVSDSIPVMYFDCSDGKTWGNPTSVTRTGQAWTYQKNNFGAKTDKVVLYGTSMGALVMFNWALANLSSVAGIVTVNGAVSLIDLHDNDRGGHKAEIETAHGTGVVASYVGNSTITARDPAQNAASFAGVPIKMFYSGNDPICIPSATTAFASASGAETVNMGNLGHATDPAYAPDVAAFIARYA